MYKQQSPKPDTLEQTLLRNEENNLEVEIRR